MLAPSDTTDAILVVNEKKLYVNKAVLSHHSDYFKALFESDFKEKSIEEIPIEDVSSYEFEALLGLVHAKPVTPSGYSIEKILEYADRFSISSVKPYLELLLIQSPLRHWEKLRIGDQYHLDQLINHAVGEFTKQDKHNFMKSRLYFSLSDNAQARVLHHLLTLYNCKC